MSLSEAVSAPKTKAAHVWQRDSLDWYVEPVRATEALLSVEKFLGVTYDPACGQGNIVTTLRAAGIRAYGTDVVDRTAGLADRSWFTGEYDFLADWPMKDAVNVVVNPPFFRAKGAEAFIRRGLELTTGKLAVFVDIRFIAGAERADGLFADHPPHRIWIVTPRVSCPPGDYLAAGNKAGNGSSDWCWLVWDLTAPKGETRIGWLRRPA